MERTDKELIVFGGEYKNPDACENVIRYVFRQKSSSPIGGNAVYPIETENVIDQFQLIKEGYHKMNGRQVFHFCLSYPDNSDDRKILAYEDAKQVSQMIGREFQNVYGIHEDTDHVHVHFAVNSVSYRNGKKITQEYLEKLLK